MELFNRIKKNKKGFTLVEIIVVLVILAILAAFTIPTMLGFVNDAKSKAYIAEAREIYVAAQAVATEQYATKGSVSSLNGSVDASGVVTADAAMKTMLGSDISKSAKWAVTLTGGKVTEVVYTTPDGKKTVTTTPGGSTVVADVVTP